MAFDIRILSWALVFILRYILVYYILSLPWLVVVGIS